MEISVEHTAQHTDRPGNDVVVDGVLCKLIGGRHLIRYDHAAEYRGCAHGTIINEVSAGKLKGFRLGRFGYIDKNELDRKLLGDAT